MDIGVGYLNAGITGNEPVQTRPLVAIFTNPRGNPEQAAKLPGVKTVLAEQGIDTFEIDCGKTDPADIKCLLKNTDGAIVLGDNSNLHPMHYRQTPLKVKGVRQKFNPDRDQVTLPAIKYCVSNDIPLLAICRGFQELIAAYGGKLEQHISLVAKNVKHASGYKSRKQRYLGVHPIKIKPRGLLAQMWNHAAPRLVNSIHRQGVIQHNVPRKFQIEAWWGKVAEAVSIPCKSFVFGTQYHIEHNPKDPYFHKIFERFGGTVHGRFKEHLPVNESRSEIQKPGIALTALTA
jgi:putative glutamine amidotransferase